MGKNICLLLFITLSVYQIQSLTCGGNCPSNNCTECICGTVSKYIDLDTFCDAVI